MNRAASTASSAVAHAERSPPFRRPRVSRRPDISPANRSAGSTGLPAPGPRNSRRTHAVRRSGPRQDREYWSATGASGREEDLRRYLDRYPNGIFAEEARSALRAIEEIRRPEVSAAEQLTWQRVEENGSIEAYREYLRRYPNGAYIDAAESEIERLEEAERGGTDRQAAARGERAMNLSATTRRTIEQRLAALDYNPGPVDGIFDDRTRNALLRYQRDRRLPATGYMNDVTMVRILADTVISIFD